MINTLLTKYNTILDTKGTTENQSEDAQINDLCNDLKYKFVQCEKCGVTYQLKLSCDKRTCVPCQIKRGRKLFNKYQSIVASWDQEENELIQFLTITNVNVLKMDKKYLKERDALFKKFLLYLKKQGYLVNYGFFNKEMTHHKIGDPKYDKRTKKQIGIYTEKDAGYHYHYHILFYGERIDLKQLNLSKIWKGISTDSFIVHLYNKFNNGEHALRYILKYVCKTQETSPEMLKYYDESKGQRYFQTFGKKYKTEEKNKLPFICSDCFGKFKTNKNSYGSNLFDENQLKFDIEKVKTLDYRKIALHVKMQLEGLDKSKQSEIQIFSIEIESKNNPLNIVEKYHSVKNNYDLIVKELSEEEVNKLIEKGEIAEIRNGHLEVLK